MHEVPSEAVVAGVAEMRLGTFSGTLGVPVGVAAQTWSAGW